MSSSICGVDSNRCQTCSGALNSLVAEDVTSNSEVGESGRILLHQRAFDTHTAACVVVKAQHLSKRCVLGSVELADGNAECGNASRRVCQSEAAPIVRANRIGASCRENRHSGYGSRRSIDIEKPARDVPATISRETADHRRVACDGATAFEEKCILTIDDALVPGAARAILDLKLHAVGRLRAVDDINGRDGQNWLIGRTRGN